jgi:hypothetical protein
MTIAARAPILAVIVLVACSSGPASVTSRAPSPSPSADLRTFTSQTYGYTVTLPKGWGGIQASERWDGNGSPGSVDLDVDQFIDLAAADLSMWAFAAPTTLGLDAYVKGTIDGTLEDHGDTCPTGPVTKDPIDVGGQPGVLLAWDCGLLINQAVVVENGVGYVFGVRDPSVKAATNSGDRRLLLGLVDSVHFAS